MALQFSMDNHGDSDQDPDHEQFLLYTRYSQQRLRAALSHLPLLPTTGAKWMRGFRYEMVGN